MYKPRKKSNALRGAHGKSRCLGSEVKDKERWNGAPIQGRGFSKGCGIEKESVTIAGVGGAETGGMRSKEESYQTLQKLKFHLHSLNELLPFQCERCLREAVLLDSKPGEG